MTTYRAYYQSPIGLLKIITDDEAIKEVSFTRENDVNNWSSEDNKKPLLKEILIQLEEYFKGVRHVFDLPLRLDGTEFQKKVWHKVMEIPYSTTASYQDIAIALGNPKAVRAVGNANNKNKIIIIIPCHRVIGKSGKLVGYGGGLYKKEWLLQHEKIHRKYQFSNVKE